MINPKILKEVLINEDFCFLARKASFGGSEVYQDIHELMQNEPDVEKGQKGH